MARLYCDTTTQQRQRLGLQSNVDAPCTRIAVNSVHRDDIKHWCSASARVMYVRVREEFEKFHPLRGDLILLL